MEIFSRCTFMKKFTVDVYSVVGVFLFVYLVLLCTRLLLQLCGVRAMKVRGGTQVQVTLRSYSEPPNKFTKVGPKKPRRRRL